MQISARQPTWRKREKRSEDRIQTDQINSSKSGRQLLLQRALSHLPRWEANNSKMEEGKVLPQTFRPIHLMSQSLLPPSPEDFHPTLVSQTPPETPLQ